MVWLCALCGELNEDREDKCHNCQAYKESFEAEEQYMDEKDAEELLASGQGRLLLVVTSVLTNSSLVVSEAFPESPRVSLRGLSFFSERIDEDNNY